MIIKRKDTVGFKKEEGYTMNTIKITVKRTFYAKNSGKDLEAKLRFQYGFPWKADNKKGGHDIIIDGRTYQVKSYHATACKGWTLDNIAIEYKGVDGFIYIDRNTDTAHVMGWTEWLAFVEAFHDLDKTSKGEPCVRINRAEKAITQYLRARA